MKTKSSIADISSQLQSFAAKRDWSQFHSPKNLAMALASEVGELLEIFQWLTEEESEFKNLSDNQFERCKEEVADVFLYLLQLCNRLNIDLLKAASEKIAINEEKYPINKSKGSNKKYNES